MALPSSIQRQLDEANSLQAGLNAQPVADEAPTPTTPEPTAAPEPAPAPAPAQDSTAAAWEQRYKSLQGMYHKEIAERRTLEAQMASLANRLKALEETPAPKAPPPKPAVDPKDVEAFGLEQIEMVQRYAEQIAAQMQQNLQAALAGVEQRLQALEGSVTGVTEKTEAQSEHMFYARLAEQVSDWEQVNTDPRFLAWLEEVDPIFGVARMVGLRRAYEARNAEQAIKVFKAFKQTLPPPPPKPESQVTPRSNSSGSAPAVAAPAAPVRVTNQEINQFYLDVAKGKYVGREQLEAEIKQRIDIAVANGLVG